MRFISAFLVVGAAIIGLVEPAFAEAAADTGAQSQLGLFAAGIGIGLAAIGGALGQAKTMSAALESIGRNPGAAGQMFVPWLLGCVFIESLVIYALVISAKLVGLF